MAETRKITMKESNVSGRLQLGVLGMAAAAFLPAFAATETPADRNGRRTANGLHA